MELSLKQEIEIRLLMARLEALKQPYRDVLGQKVICINWNDLINEIEDYTKVKFPKVIREE